MLKIENTEVLGCGHAIRGMRNPKNSWEKSDSQFAGSFSYGLNNDVPVSIGKNDLNLMTTLCNAGTDHRKFMRMIIVYLDVTAPLYWWKEFDTYKVGTVANSCSTMHSIADKEFTLDDFSWEHLMDNAGIEISVPDHAEIEPLPFSARTILEITIDTLNSFRNMYKTAINPKSKKQYWWQMIQLLPSSYNQKRTVMLNYEVLANIYKSRRNHKLDEWHTFCDWIEKLPYSDLITGKKE